jgi:hypothetical protein
MVAAGHYRDYGCTEALSKTCCPPKGSVALTNTWPTGITDLEVTMNRVDQACWRSAHHAGRRGMRCSERTRTGIARCKR